jgi:hypothetical protein
MPQTARSYLLDRFRTDAVALRQRADAMGARGAAPVPGPDATMSRRMAAACERVVAMLEAVPDADDSAWAMATIIALVPLLEQHAAQEASAPPVRAVYIGAATRIREVQAAEVLAAKSRGTSISNGAHDVSVDRDVADGTDDLTDADDDSLDDSVDDLDELHDGHRDDDEQDEDDVDDDDLHEHIDDRPEAPPRGPRA